MHTYIPGVHSAYFGKSYTNTRTRTTGTWTARTRDTDTTTRSRTRTRTHQQAHTYIQSTHLVHLSIGIEDVLQYKEVCAIWSHSAQRNDSG